MSSKRQQIPAIRFKGFTDAWEQRKLLDMSERICVGFVGTCEQYYTDSTGIPMYRTGNLNGLYLNKNDLKYVTQEFHNKNMKSQLKRGDILIARHGDSGKAVIYNYFDEANCLNIVIIRPNSSECDHRFLAQCINSPMPSKQIKSLSAGSTQSVINTKEIEKLVVSVPRNVEEQKVLANFFFNLDNVIALHQRQSDKYTELKKSMLQKMFPQDGEKVPEVRFGGFTEEWEQRKVGEYLQESRVPGSDGSVARKLTVKLWRKGVIPKEESYQGSTATNYFVRKSGQFIYGKLDFLNQAFGIVPYHLDGYESTLDSPAFDIFPTMNPNFFLEYVSRKQFYLFQGTLANGSRKAKRIHTETFFEMPINVPLFEEQTQVGSFFTKLDDTIALHQQKVDGYQKLKNAILEKMFV